MSLAKGVEQICSTYPPKPGFRLLPQALCSRYVSVYDGLSGLEEEQTETVILELSHSLLFPALGIGLHPALVLPLLTLPGSQ